MKGRLVVSLIAATFCIEAEAAPDFTSMQMSFDDKTHSMFLWHSGWFSIDRYPVRYHNRSWHVQWADGSWSPIATPFVGKYGDKAHLVLDTYGRIFVNGPGNEQFEIRWRNGEWEDNGSGERNSLWLDMLEDR